MLETLIAKGFSISSSSWATYITSWVKVSAHQHRVHSEMSRFEQNLKYKFPFSIFFPSLWKVFKKQSTFLCLFFYYLFQRKSKNGIILPWVKAPLTLVSHMKVLVWVTAMSLLTQLPAIVWEKTAGDGLLLGPLPTMGKTWVEFLDPGSCLVQKPGNWTRMKDLSI